MTNLFTEMTTQFEGLVEAISGGRKVSLDGASESPRLTITDGRGRRVLRVMLFDFPDGRRGRDVPFIYDLKDETDVPVLPVALPGDAVEALTKVRELFG